MHQVQAGVAKIQGYGMSLIEQINMYSMAAGHAIELMEELAKRHASGQTTAIPTSKTTVPPTSQTTVPPTSETTVPPTSQTTVPPCKYTQFNFPDLFRSLLLKIQFRI